MTTPAVDIEQGGQTIERLVDEFDAAHRRLRQIEALLRGAAVILGTSGMPPHRDRDDIEILIDVAIGLAQGGDAW